MFASKPLKSNPWSSSASRIYYSALLHCLKTQTPIDGLSQRCLSYSAYLLNEQQQSPSSNQTFSHDAQTVKPSPTILPPLSSSTSSSETLTGATAIGASASSSFADVFTSLFNENQPQPIDESVPLYDCSSLDSMIPPRAQELRWRIDYQLSQDPDNIYKLLSRSTVESFDTLVKRDNSSRFLKTFNPIEGEIAPFGQGPLFSESESMTPSEFHVVINLTRWQASRYRLLNQITRSLEKYETRKKEFESKEEKESSTDGEESTSESLDSHSSSKLPFRKFYFFSDFKFIGISQKNKLEWDKVVTNIAQQERVYIREFTRLFRLTGDERLRDHIRVTTPKLVDVLEKLYRSWSLNILPANAVDPSLDSASTEEPPLESVKNEEVTGTTPETATEQVLEPEKGESYSAPSLVSENRPILSAQSHIPSDFLHRRNNVIGALNIMEASYQYLIDSASPLESVVRSNSSQNPSDDASETNNDSIKKEFLTTARRKFQADEHSLDIVPESYLSIMKWIPKDQK